MTYFYEVDYVTINYAIENTDFTQTTQLEMNNEIGKVAKIQFELPNEYEEKTYTVKISATDHSHTKNSNEIFYSFNDSYDIHFNHNRVEFTFSCRFPILASTYLTQFLVGTRHRSAARQS